jgi:hypothetical protein
MDEIEELLRTKLHFEDDTLEYALSMLNDDMIETDEDRRSSVMTLMEDEPSEEQQVSSLALEFEFSNDA